MSETMPHTKQKQLLKKAITALGSKPWRSLRCKGKKAFSFAVVMALIVQLLVPVFGGGYLQAAKAESRPFSGVWYGNYNTRPADWNQRMAQIKSSGVDNYFPDSGNVGQAFYPSSITPVIDPYLDKLVPAAKANGVKVHLWHQNFNVWPLNGSVHNTLKAEDRLMRRVDGTQVNHWMDIANDANRQLDIQVIMDKVGRYHPNIAGINLDYIRFPSKDTSYTNAARAKFEAQYGKVTSWPADVASGGSRYAQYAEFQRNLITNHVKNIYTTVKAKYPDIQVTACVWPDYASTRADRYQDWPAWKNHIDAFIPMTYTDPAGNGWFERMTVNNISLASPTPIYVGIGTFGEPGQVTNPADNMLYQFKYSVSKGAKGAVIFEDNPHFRDNFLPLYRSYIESTYPITSDPAPTDPPVVDSPPATDVSTENIAQGKPVYSSSIEAYGLEASKAVDGRLDTRWSSQFADPQWLYVDLGSSKDLGKVVLKWEAAYGKAYEIRVSDDANTWRIVHSTTSADGNVDEIVLPAGTKARYVQVHGTERGTIYGYSLWEVEVYPVIDTGTSPDTGTTPPTPPLDVTAPQTTITDPDGTKILTGTEKLIKGATTDDNSVAKVEIAIQREDGAYWTGSGWSSAVTWLPASIVAGANTSTVSWSYLWQVIWSDGLTYHIRARGTDISGNIESTSHVTVKVDNVAPAGKITINSGAESTVYKFISVTNSITGASQMRFTVDGVTWTAWESYKTGKRLKLTAGAGLKTVKGQFSDGVNIYETSDSIYLRR